MRGRSLPRFEIRDAVHTRTRVIFCSSIKQYQPVYIQSMYRIFFILYVFAVILLVIESPVHRPYHFWYRFTVDALKGNSGLFTASLTFRVWQLIEPAPRLA